MKELTLKELKAVVRRRVRSMLNTAHKQGRTVTLADCINASENDLRSKLKEINPPVIRGLLDNEYDRWIISAERDIRECAESCYISTLKTLKSKDVARAGASAIVETTLKEKGLDKFFLERQVHGLKVITTLPKGKRFCFRIRYSHLQEDLSHVAEGIDTAIHLTNLFDRITSIMSTTH